jgi:hypothetical protein
MIKLKDKPNKRSNHIELQFSNIKRVYEYQMTNMTSAIYVSQEGYVTYYTCEEMINTSHPRYALPFIKKTYGKYMY